MNLISILIIAVASVILIASILAIYADSANIEWRCRNKK